MKYLFKVFLYLLLPFIYQGITYVLMQYKSVAYIAWDMEFITPLAFLLWFLYGVIIIGIKLKNEYIKNRLFKR